MPNGLFDWVAMGILMGLEQIWLPLIRGNEPFIPGWQPLMFWAESRLMGLGIGDALAIVKSH